MATDPSRGVPGSRLGTLFRWIAVISLTGFVGLLVYGVMARAPNRTIDDALAEAERIDAPPFELALLHRGRPPERLATVLSRAGADRRMALAELRGFPVVLNFWASWCDPCRSEAPVLERGWQRFGPMGVVFLGLDMQDAREDAADFLKEFAVSYPNVREAGKETSRRYGLTGLPETFFISASGQVVSHVIGALTGQQLEAGIEAARAGRALPAARGVAREETK